MFEIEALEFSIIPNEEFKDGKVRIQIPKSKIRSFLLKK